MLVSRILKENLVGHEDPLRSTDDISTIDYQVTVDGFYADGVRHHTWISAGRCPTLAAEIVRIVSELHKAVGRYLDRHVISAPDVPGVREKIDRNAIIRQTPGELCPERFPGRELIRQKERVCVSVRDHLGW